jgi:hypothetical protein
MAKPRFVSVYKGADGVRQWRYSPPQDLVDNGIVVRCTLGTDRRRAFAEAIKLNKRLTTIVLVTLLALRLSLKVH